VHVQKLDSWRVSMTVPLLSAAAHVLFISVGAEKAEPFATAMLEPSGTVPASLVRSAQTTWMIDRAAAQKWIARL
jgi:6-phosphogluconolactonase